jgi:hypothetical protein
MPRTHAGVVASIYRWTSGGCLDFAQALHERFGYPLVVITPAYNRDYAIHVVCEVPGGYVDALGFRTEAALRKTYAKLLAWDAKNDRKEGYDIPPERETLLFRQLPLSEIEDIMDTEVRPDPMYLEPGAVLPVDQAAAIIAANPERYAPPGARVPSRTGSRSEWAELGRRGLPVPPRTPSKKLVHIVSLKELARIWRDREGGATGDLLAWVEVNLGAGPSYREGIPIDDLLDRMGDWAWGESDAIAVERCHEELVLLATHFNRLRFPLTVYRGLEVHPKTLVNMQESGDHWTPNRAIALAFAEGRHQSSHRERTGDDGGEPVLLSGTISGPHAIRWRETFNGYFDYTVDHAGDPEVAEQQVATSLVHDVQIVPISTRASRTGKRGSRAIAGTP